MLTINFSIFAGYAVDNANVFTTFCTNGSLNTSSTRKFSLLLGNFQNLLIIAGTIS